MLDEKEQIEKLRAEMNVRPTAQGLQSLNKYDYAVAHPPKKLWHLKIYESKSLRITIFKGNLKVAKTDRMPNGGYRTWYPFSFTWWPFRYPDQSFQWRKLGPKIQRNSRLSTNG